MKSHKNSADRFTFHLPNHVIDTPINLCIDSEEADRKREEREGVW